MAWTDPRTWTAGEIVTAALLNLHLRDNLKAIGDAATAYGTPTTILTAATTSPTLGAGSSANAYFTQAGKRVDFRIEVVSGTSGTATGTGTYQFLLPATPRAGTLAPLGHSVLQDGSGAAVTVGSLLWSTGTVAHLYLDGLTATSSGTGNVIANRRYLITGSYEAA